MFNLIGSTLLLACFYPTNGEIVIRQCHKVACINSTNSTDNSVLTYFSGQLSKNTYLKVDNLVANISTPNQTLCLKECSRNNKCHSLNYGDGLTCELLNENMYEHKKRLIADTSWNHISLVSDVCNRKPCLNNGICVPIYEQNSFICKCIGTKHNGKYCETKIRYASNEPSSYKFTFDKVDARNTGFYIKEQIMSLKNGKALRVPDRRTGVLACSSDTEQCVTLTAKMEEPSSLNGADCPRGHMTVMWLKIGHSDNQFTTKIIYRPPVIMFMFLKNQNSFVITATSTTHGFGTMITNVINPFQWNHFIIVVSNELSIYLNGIQLTVPISSGPFTNSTLPITDVLFQKGHYYVDEIAFYAGIGSLGAVLKDYHDQK